jgi:hypothetical protein
MMFALLRHIGQTSRYEIPPRPAALCACLDPNAIALRGHLADAWRHVSSFGNFLRSVHFSVLPTAVCVAMMLHNEQARDALRALGAEPGLTALLLVVAAVLCAAAAA